LEGSDHSLAPCLSNAIMYSVAEQPGVSASDKLIRWSRRPPGLELSAVRTKMGGGLRSRLPRQIKTNCTHFCDRRNVKASGRKVVFFSFFQSSVMCISLPVM